MLQLLATLVLLASPITAAEAAAAQKGAPDGGVAEAQADGGPQDDAALQRELERAMKGDAQAAQEKGQPAPAAATETPQGPAPSGGRAGQSLNPDLSAIVDADFGYARRAPSYLNGDDPDLKTDRTHKALGPLVQEVELAFSAIVDPYFKGEVYLTIPNLSGLEVEEAFATTTSLPANLQVKMGSFRSAFGRQNGMHLHVQDFTRRPLINSAFLGDDGLRGAAVQLSWLAPLPFYLTLFGELRRVNAPDLPPAVGAGEIPVPPVVHSFGGGNPNDLNYVGVAKLFVPVGDELSVYAGASVVKGVSPGLFVPDPTGTRALGTNRSSVLLGGDLYVKWKPANESGGYRSVAWQTETVFRHLAAGDGLGDEWDGGLYSQVVVQLARRFFLGVRGDLLGLPTSSVLSRTLRGSVSLTFQASEFARVRAYAEAENSYAVGGSLYPVQPVPTSFATFLQLEISIGAHGAHAF